MSRKGKIAELKVFKDTSLKNEHFHKFFFSFSIFIFWGRNFSRKFAILLQNRKSFLRVLFSEWRVSRKWYTKWDMLLRVSLSEYFGYIDIPCYISGIQINPTRFLHCMIDEVITSSKMGFVFFRLWSSNQLQVHTRQLGSICRTLHWMMLDLARYSMCTRYSKNWMKFEQF